MTPTTNGRAAPRSDDADLEAVVIRALSRSAMVSEDSVTPDMPLADLGMGSLEQIECMMMLEEELQLELPTSDLRRLRTVRDVIDVVHETANAAR